MRNTLYTLSLIVIAVSAVAAEEAVYLQADEGNKKRGLLEYYSFLRDPTYYVKGGATQNQHFETSLTLDTRSGDVALRVLSKDVEGTELNLQYNFGYVLKPSYSEKMSRLRLEFENVDQKIVINSEGKSLDEIINEIDEQGGIRQGESIDVLASLLDRDKGMVILDAGEEFIKREKIWATWMWKQLCEASEKRPTHRFKVECHIILKSRGKFYSLRPSFIIDARTIRTMKNIESRFEREQRLRPPSGDDEEPEFMVDPEKFNIQREADGNILIHTD